MSYTVNSGNIEHENAILSRNFYSADIKSRIGDWGAISASCKSLENPVPISNNLNGGRIPDKSLHRSWWYLGKPKNLRINFLTKWCYYLLCTIDSYCMIMTYNSSW
jgi:hypothetical protein